MEYLPHIISIIAIIVSIISIFLQYFGKIKSEKLKINKELDLQRYKDLKNLHIKASEIQRKVYAIETEVLTVEELYEFFVEVNEQKKLFQINKFLFEGESIKKIEKYVNEIKQEHIKNSSNVYAGRTPECPNSLIDFSSDFIQIINEDLSNLLNNNKKS